ncbi:MAG: cytochrome c [Burkholderiales bacterium]
MRPSETRSLFSDPHLSSRCKRGAGLAARDRIGTRHADPEAERRADDQYRSGEKLYAASCAQCHGADLRGSKEGPPLLHRVYEPSHHGDAAFQIAVKFGSRQHHWNFGDMKPVPGVSADDVAHITAFVRTEQRKAGIR